MKAGFYTSVAIVCLMLLLSCGGGGGDSSPSTGTVSVSLADASTTDYRAVYVTISQVAVHRDGSDWVTVSTPNRTVNLLSLVNGVRQDLGLATLTSGHYTQLRMILSSTPDSSVNVLSQAHPFANYFIDNAGESRELKVPSGFQTGIKVVKGFDINADQTTELVLDFDAVRSIVKAGASGKWLLKPTVKVLNTVEYSIVQGNAGQPGVLVSAQIYDGTAAAPEDRIEVRAATVSDESGNYKLFLEPGVYTLVGYKDGSAAYNGSAKIVTTAGSTVTADFSLAASTTGTFTITAIDIPGADQEQYATVSVRQDATVDGNMEQIEVKSLNVANGGTVGTTLPVGAYVAVLSTFGKTTQVQAFTISGGSTTSIGPVSF